MDQKTRTALLCQLFDDRLDRMCGYETIPDPAAGLHRSRIPLYAKMEPGPPEPEDPDSPRSQLMMTSAHTGISDEFVGDVIESKLELLSGQRVVQTNREMNVEFRADYFCRIDRNRPLQPAESPLPFDFLSPFNGFVFAELEAGHTEPLIRRTIGGALCLENEPGGEQRVGKLSMTILSRCAPEATLIGRYSFKAVKPWLFHSDRVLPAGMYIVALDALREFDGGEAFAYLQLFEQDPSRRENIWARILAAQFADADYFKALMQYIDPQTYGRLTA